MNNLLYLISIILLFSINTVLNASEKLQVSFHYAAFNSPNDGPYIETYMTVLGQSSTFTKNDNNKFQSSIEITMIFKQESKVINFTKFNLLSPELSDTTEAKPNFIDQQRISLPNGIYNFELIIKDKNSDAKEFSFNDIITINFNDTEICFSGVQFIDKFSETKTENILSKNGYDFVPYVSNFFPDNMNELIFYTEIYNISTILKDEKDILVQYFIENFSNGKTIDQYSKYKKQTAKDINVVFAQLNISDLPSGNYNLNIEIKNKENVLLKSQKVFFQRSNPEKDINIEDISSINIADVFTNKYKSIDTLSEYIRCVRPIADDLEKRFIDNNSKSTTLSFMQQYFYSFWAKRNSVNPEQEWEYYRKQVDLVNNLYSSSIIKGYESDRGRIYLKHGSPNSITESKHEPSAYPYEIWHYYKIGEEINRQVNVKFVFYNPELAGNDYTLLHSNARGEIQDRNWERRLSKRNNTLYNHDVINSDDQYGGRAIDNFNK